MDRLCNNELRELAALCPGGVEVNVSLSDISNWGIGGLADLILRPDSASQVANLRRWFDEKGIKPVVIGLTSNLLFADEGVRAPIIQITNRMSNVDVVGDRVVAQSGAWVPALARSLMRSGLTGGEHICGIPGTVGGLICMNGGSQRKGIASNILRVESVDSKGEVISRSVEECDFGYRHSAFQKNREIITAVTLGFSFDRKAFIRRRMLNILAERRKKFPRKLPNCGSVFKSNPEMYAEIGPPGAAIEKLGFKGVRVGGAQVSPMHANFIVNAGGASAQDVILLINQINLAVEEATGFRMSVEACYVNQEGAIASLDHFS